MAFSFLFARVLVALTFICTVLAVTPFDAYVNKPGDAGNVTVAINVPSNGTDDLYFRFSASTLWQWAAFGFGSQMQGALMFIVYPAADGQSITVSPRIATGHSPPSVTTDVQVSVLNGSGINADGVYVVNAHCTGCRKWKGGSINIASEQQPMIYALGPKGSSLKTNDLSAKITQHDSRDTFALNLKNATGQAGVPVLVTSKDTTSVGEDAEEHAFPIAIHALLLVACFLFVLPGGYLFLRVFNRVWLHAGIQSLGLVCLIAGVAAGIVINVQTKRAFSYHQALGILTTTLVLAAFILGLISHQYFKRNKQSSPLMKFHRMVGPAAIVSGWGTTISGFAFRGEPQRILPFTVILLAVIIFVGAIAFLMRKRAVKKAALVTPAAQNFNAGYYGQSENPPPAYGNPNAPKHGYYGQNNGQTDAVPMQTFGRPYEQQQAPQHQQQYQYGQGYTQQSARDRDRYYAQKEADVSVLPGGRF